MFINDVHNYNSFSFLYFTLCKFIDSLKKLVKASETNE